MFRRIFCILLCLLLAAVPALSLAQTFTMAGFDGQDSTHDWTTNSFFTRMEARTGLTFEFRQYNKAEDWAKAKEAMFGGGDMPDVLFKAALTTDELIRFTESGQLIDLLPLLEENAPNLWKLLQDNPEWLRAITLPNGKVGALPSIQTMTPQNAMWINKTWLDALKLNVPTDMESLRKVLTAFRDRDPNGNGKNDEVPMLFLGPWELKFFSHAWGVVANDFNIYLKDGQVHYWPTEDSFFEMAETLRGFYADGLLDPNGFTTADSLRRITDVKAEVTYGAMFSATPVNLLPYDMAVNNYVLLEPFVYEGKQIYRDLFGEITRGTFAITSACEDPAALLRWVDVLYTPEGAAEAMSGVENEDYYVDADGYWDWIGGVESLGMEGLSSLTVYDTGDMPWLFPQEFYNRYSDKNVRSLNEQMTGLCALAVKPFPAYTLTTEQTLYAMELQQGLGTYVDRTLARFVLGELDINDETKAEFLNTLQELGVDEMTAFWQEVAQGL